MARTFIIAADPDSAAELVRMIEQTDDQFQVCNIALSVKEAKAFMVQGKFPELIISDVELSDGLSFEIFKAFPGCAPIIYCADCRKYALTAFDNNGIDYLLKPLIQSKLQKSLKKFSQFKELFREDMIIPRRNAPKLFPYPTNYKSSILAYFKDQIIPVSLDKTQYIYYNNYQVTVHTNDAQYETRDTLNNLLTSLNPKQFFRANRQFIIHRRSVKTIQQHFGRKLLVGITTPTPEPVIISKANTTDFLKWMEGIQTSTTIPMLEKTARLVS